MTTTAPTCQHQWVNRSSMGDPWRECSLCGKQEDVEVAVNFPDRGPDDHAAESLRYMQQRYGVQPRRRVRTRRWWIFCWSLLAFEVLQIAVAATILVVK